jgi:hypothetical protein
VELNQAIGAWLMFASGMLAAAMVFIGAALFFIDRSGNGRRKPCRRACAGNGCNQRPRTDGPASGFSQGEHDERI